MPNDSRQPYPVGDLSNGQWVQVKKAPLDTIDWMDYEDLTVSSTVLALTRNDNGYDAARILVETDSIRFRLDGGVPSATSGIAVTAGTMIELDSAKEITEFRVVRVTTDVTLRVQYGRLVRSIQ